MNITRQHVIMQCLATTHYLFRQSLLLHNCNDNCIDNKNTTVCTQPECVNTTSAFIMPFILCSCMGVVHICMLVCLAVLKVFFYCYGPFRGGTLKEITFVHAEAKCNLRIAICVSQTKKMDNDTIIALIKTIFSFMVHFLDAVD